MSTKFKWACPKCGAKANGHGKGGQKHCRGRWSSECSGFICECEHETGKDHGLTLEDPCTNAYCYHCGEGCTFPKAPKGLQSWEKKALEAGWTMSLSRRRELGLEETKKKVVKTNDKRVKAAVKGDGSAPEPEPLRVAPRGCATMVGARPRLGLPHQGRMVGDELVFARGSPRTGGGPLFERERGRGGVRPRDGGETMNAPLVYVRGLR